MHNQTLDFRSGPMSSLQMLTIAICFAINFLDGMDILAIAFTAPAIGEEWALSPQQLGVLFSTGLAGMMFGSLVIAPVADRVGRRPMVLACLVIVTSGMLLSAFCESFEQLAACRVLTGVGVGAMLPSINTQVAEYASHKRRNLSISILQVGYVVGGTVGGIIAAYLILSYDWRAVFLFSGMLSGILIPVVFFLFPESIDHLMLQRNETALSKVNKILARMRQRQLYEFPETKVGAVAVSAKLTTLASREYRVRTLAIWAAYFVTFFALYFILTWTPKILVNAGLSVEMGIGGGVIVNAGGIIGSVLLGFIASRYSLTNVVALYIALAVVSMIAFGAVGMDLLVLLSTAFVLGFFVLGCTVGLYAIVPNLYPPSIRTTGTGWAIGIGRLGAIAGPYFGGVFIGLGWERAQYFLVMSVPLLAGAAIVFFLGRGEEWSQSRANS